MGTSGSAWTGGLQKKLSTNDKYSEFNHILQITTFKNESEDKTAPCNAPKMKAENQEQQDTAADPCGRDYFIKPESVYSLAH